MHNLRTIFLFLLYATQISAMKLGQNQGSENIIIPQRVETLKQLATRQCTIKYPHICRLPPERCYIVEKLEQLTARCIIKHPRICRLQQRNRYEPYRECDRQHFLVHGKYILGFKKKDFTFSLAKLVKHKKINLLETKDQHELNLQGMQIDVINSRTLQTISSRLFCLKRTYLKNGYIAGITQLSLSKNQLKKIPKSIGQLISLEALFLGHNQLTELPNSMSKLVNLIILNLFYNRFAELSESVCQLISLTHLTLSNNQISKITNSIGKLTTLHVLDLSNNLISTIPNTIGKLTSPIALDLGLFDISNNLLSQKEQGKIRVLLPRTHIISYNQQEDSHA